MLDNAHTAAHDNDNRKQDDTSYLMTYCFKCHTKRRIIDGKWRKTENHRKLCEGKCIECKGKVALMSGYWEFPENIYTWNEKKHREKIQNDSEE